MKYIDEISKNREIQLEKIDDSDNVEQRKQELFEMAVSEMKQTTRRYAKTQLKWVRNRFIKSKLVK